MPERIFFSRLLGSLNSWSLHLGMLGTGLQVKSTTFRPVSLLSVVSKIFEKHLNKFVDFQYVFSYSRSTAALLTAASEELNKLPMSLELLEL